MYFSMKYIIMEYQIQILCHRYKFYVPQMSQRVERHGIVHPEVDVSVRDTVLKVEVGAKVGAEPVPQGGDVLFCTVLHTPPWASTCSRQPPAIRIDFIHC